MIEKNKLRAAEENASKDRQNVYYVYVIQSLLLPKKIYIGYTNCLKTRLVTHNNGGSSHTSKFKPWSLISYTGFSCKETAVQFEKYLKTQSGRAFITKRLLPAQ